jgi:hypothetical protein
VFKGVIKMKVIKTKSRIFSEKLGIIQERFRKNGWFVVNSEYYQFGVKLKKGLFTMAYEFNYEDDLNILIYKGQFFEDDDCIKCVLKKIEKVAKVKVVVYI